MHINTIDLTYIFWLLFFFGEHDKRTTPTTTDKHPPNSFHGVDDTQT